MGYLKKAEFWHKTGEAPSGQTIVKPTVLGPVTNTDTKLLICGLFQKGRVLAQDGVPSPRMRGKLEVRRTAPTRRRSIPAHAGETAWRPVGVETARVHPRAYGGNTSGQLKDFTAKGPSPRMRGKPGSPRIRGKHERTTQGFYCKGSIPAHAGETRTSSTRSSNSRVHPRACGGNPDLCLLFYSSAGTSSRRALKAEMRARTNDEIM